MESELDAGLRRLLFARAGPHRGGHDVARQAVRAVLRRWGCRHLLHRHDPRPMLADDVAAGAAALADLASIWLACRVVAGAAPRWAHLAHLLPGSATAELRRLRPPTPEDVLWFLEQWRVQAAPPPPVGSDAPPDLGLEGLCAAQALPAASTYRAGTRKWVQRYGRHHPARWVDAAAGRALAVVYPELEFRPANLMYYPAGGWMGWHTNADRPGTRWYLNWCPPRPRSAFLTHEGEMVRLPDRGGWAVNRFEIPGGGLWHAVDAATPRWSVGFRVRPAQDGPAAGAAVR